LLCEDGLPIAIAIAMHVHVSGSNISKTLRRYVELSLSTALGDAAERIVAIEVELSDANKPRTRNHNLCGIRAELRGAGVVLVHGRSADAHTAVDRAGLRLKTALTFWPASQTYGRFDSAS
jgi:ribosome-associated translation inhibitor RaiA